MYMYSSGIVPVSFASKTPKYLLLRSKNYFDFPKGKLEDGETFLEAALRETLEESSLYDLSFKWGTEYYQTEPYRTKHQGKKRNKIVRYYIAEVLSGEPKLLPNEETGIVEHDEFAWVSYDEARSLPLRPRIERVCEWAREIVDRGCQ